MADKVDKLKFPDYFPQGCPPSEAVFKEMDVYRLCVNSTPCEEDFQSFYLSDPKKYAGNIRAYGISTFPSFKACESALRKCVNLRNKYKFCAHGITYIYTGKVMNTPSKANPKHITWWLYDGVKPHTYFKVCCQKLGNSDE